VSCRWKKHLERGKEYRVTRKKKRGDSHSPGSPRRFTKKKEREKKKKNRRRKKEKGKKKKKNPECPIIFDHC